MQTKKFHLVKWATVKCSKSRGGLGIRDPEKMNKALGAKLIWRLVTGKKEWWKEVIRKKYIRRPRSKILTCPWTGKGTSLWLLCKASLNLIQSNYYWIPGSRKKIKVWESSILGHPSLSSLLGMRELSEWVRGIGISTLFDLSSWNLKGSWNGWKDFHPPEHLEAAKNLLFTSLHGKTPINKSSKDYIGYGKNGTYTVKEGYKKLTMEPAANESLWKKVWHSDNIPKVNYFIWTLMHNKLLTAENLRKRGIAGPSICAICNSESETSIHIFLQCSVSLKFWKSILPPGSQFKPSDSLRQLLEKWIKYFPGNLNKKILKHLWNTIPKNLC